jgi:hypothetical protein
LLVVHANAVPQLMRNASKVSQASAPSKVHCGDAPIARVAKCGRTYVGVVRCDFDLCSACPWWTFDKTQTRLLFPTLGRFLENKLSHVVHGSGTVRIEVIIDIYITIVVFGPRHGHTASIRVARHKRAFCSTRPACEGAKLFDLCPMICRVADRGQLATFQSSVTSSHETCGTFVPA